ncbi:MAG: hypothetical protein RL701_490 [Pseudomonadota bacterium]|jgi:phosphoribosylanthranilate isomerase
MNLGGHKLALKICGVTRSAELLQLDRAGVDYAGLWCGMSGASRSLSMPALRELLSVKLHHVRRILVTIHSDIDRVVEAARAPGVAGVQLQGFELPQHVKEIKRRLGSERLLLKVLHVQEGRCLEMPLLAAYATCGADGFIVDSFASRAQPGSTGIPLSHTVLAAVAAPLGRARVFAAGGVTASDIAPLARLGLGGVDVDGAARRHDSLDAERVGALTASVKAVHR